MSTAESTERSIDSEPTARVNTSPDGDTLGVCLFLGESDLEALGLDDADHVQYQVENGDLRVTKVGSE